MGALATFERREAEQFAREFERLFYLRDAAAMASYYTEDAKLMADDRPAIQGRRAIEEFWEAACAAAGTISRTIVIEEVETSGNLGYLVSAVTLRIPSAEEQASIITFKDVTVWKREADGGWRLALDIANRNAPLPIPGPARSINTLLES